MASRIFHLLFDGGLVDQAAVEFTVGLKHVLFFFSIIGVALGVPEHPWDTA